MQLETYLNIPAVFDIKINERITVSVESLAPAWLMLLLKRLATYRAKRERPFIEAAVEQAAKKAGGGDDHVQTQKRFSVELSSILNDHTMFLGDGETEREELEIIRLMTIPNVVWKETKGDFSNYKFKFTIEDMQESFTELLLMQIWEAFWIRNSVFDRKKR